MVTKCLDICQALTNQGRSFNFTVNIESSFSFSLDTRANPILPDVVKKKLSPSALRRNLRRREEFLKRKSEAATKSDTHLEAEKSSQVENFQCNQCDQCFRTENGLNIHIGKTHKDKIPQLDGFIEKITAETAVQTCDISNKSLTEAEVQTEPGHVTVAVKEVSKTYKINVKESLKDKIDEELERFWEGNNINEFSVNKEQHFFSVDISCREFSESFTASSAASLLNSLPWPEGICVTRSKPTRYLEKNP